MTALIQPPGRLLSITVYAALGEDDRNRWELQEGNLVMSPDPSPRHMVVAAELYVVGQTEFDRVARAGGLLRAASTVLVAEIVSPGSRRTDNLIKRGEYADAGIPAYWIIDAEEPISLVACHLAGALGYQDRGAVTGVFETAEPFPVRIDLDALC